MRSNRFENGLFILMKMKPTFTRKVFQSCSLVLTVLKVKVLRTPKWPIPGVHSDPPYSSPGHDYICAALTRGVRSVSTVVEIGTQTS